jgi:hypothetical protein
VGSIRHVEANNADSPLGMDVPNSQTRELWRSTDDDCYASYEVAPHDQDRGLFNQLVDSNVALLNNVAQVES